MLADSINQNKSRINEVLHIGYANWDSLLNRIEAQEESSHEDFADEQVWTFLVVCIYAIQGMDGINALAQALIKTKLPSPTKAWFEVLPLPLRLREGSTHLDLAFGTISQRSGTQSGIKLERNENSWICFVECKWYSDIAGYVSHDRQRNQLARVIENALYFNRGDWFPKTVHVTLITPEVFESSPTNSRFYQYKYAEYRNVESGAKHLVRDLATSCLPFRRPFPDINERLSSLHLNWVSYETLFRQAPKSPLKQPFLDFANKFNGTRRTLLSQNKLDGQ